MQETWVPSLGWEDSPGERNDNLLQYSCLKNPMDRGTCWAILCGVAKSDTTEQLTVSNLQNKQPETPSEGTASLDRFLWAFLSQSTQLCNFPPSCPPGPSFPAALLLSMAKETETKGIRS